MLRVGLEVIVTHRQCICLFVRLFFLEHLLIYLYIVLSHSIYISSPIRVFHHLIAGSLKFHEVDFRLRYIDRVDNHNFHVY